MKTLGPTSARILILADYPSPAERASQLPLSDWAGDKFFSILSSIGILKSTVFIASYLNIAPPKEELKNIISNRKTCPGADWRWINGAWCHPSVGEAHTRLLALLEQVQPTIVLALGSASLWALTGQTNTLKWRGSRLSRPEWPFTILPTFAPRILQTAPEHAHILRADLTRLRSIYEGSQVPRNYSFTIAPTIETATAWLIEFEEKANETPYTLSADLETRNHHIACIGLADNADSAICIPFLHISDSSPFYWPVEHEAIILWHLHRLFRHPSITWLGQNFLYDCQYFHRFWLALPKIARDTMIGHHAIHSNTRKGLDFLSSLYAHDHIYWKDDIKEWDPKLGERQYWNYNCKDACVTWEIWNEILSSAKEKGMVC